MLCFRYEGEYTYLWWIVHLPIDYVCVAVCGCVCVCVATVVSDAQDDDFTAGAAAMRRNRLDVCAKVLSGASASASVACLLFAYSASLSVRWDASPWLQSNVRVNVKVCGIWVLEMKNLLWFLWLRAHTA